MSEFKCVSHRKGGRLGVSSEGRNVRIDIRDVQTAEIMLATADAVPLARAILDAADKKDAVVLDGLPEVERDGRGRLWCAGDQWIADSVGDLSIQARAYAAVARYLDQHPPVDPQVERLADQLAEVLAADSHTPWIDPAEARSAAESLIAAGVRVTEEAEK